MDGKAAVGLINRERHYLNNILKDFKPEHGDYKPAEEMLTVAQQIKHISHTVNWFMDGAFGTGFDMNFEQYLEDMKKPITLDEAKDMLNKSYDKAIAELENKTEADLVAPMPDNPIFGQAPKMVIITSNAEHTAHHRGSLAVYLRMLGITPTMVYTE